MIGQPVYAYTRRCSVRLIRVSDCSQGCSAGQRQHETCKWVQIVWKETRAGRRYSLRRRATVNSTCRETRYRIPPPPHPFRAPSSNPACTEAVSLRPAFGPFEVEQAADSANIVLMILWQRRRPFTTTATAAVRYWHAADRPRADGHVRKLSHRLYPALVAHHPPSDNWRDWATETRRLPDHGLASNCTYCLHNTSTLDL